MNRLNCDVAIIGGGPAGLAAAVAAYQENPNLSIVVLERDRELGGILNQCIHNGFGLHHFGEELTGPEYAQRFVEQVRATRVDCWTDAMVLSLSPEREIVAVSPAHGLVHLQAKAVVLAMGCRERTRGALTIPGTRPAGVYTAGCAQRLVNMEGLLPGKQVVILGSGDIGLIMARRMTWEGAKVELVCELMPYSSGLNRNIVQCVMDNDIPLKFNHTVTRIHGKERVEGVTISEVDPATRKPIEGTEQFYPCDTLLLSVGLIPENELTLGTGAAMDRVTGGAEVDETRETSVPGIFACGNVLHVHDLVDNVSMEAAIAGRSAAAYAARGEACPVARRVEARGGVRYVVPQRIRADAQGEIPLMLRVGDVYKDATLIARCGETILAKRKKRIFTPGEMETLPLDAQRITGDIIVEMEAQKA